MKRSIVSLAVLAVLAGCAVHQKKEVEGSASAQPAGEIALFSTNPPRGLPDGWEPVTLLRTKKETQYQLVEEQGRTVLHARAVGASSGLLCTVDIDPAERPWLQWRWKIAGLIKGADNFLSGTEDSPVRIVLGFDGDKGTLPFVDQIFFEMAQTITGRELPYATLMYIWENKAPVGTVIPNSRSKRFQKIVAASGPEGVGQWRDFTRNIVEDYEKAFGEKPGRLINIGILTDTDNTGETADAWYGDIRLLREAP